MNTFCTVQEIRHKQHENLHPQKICKTAKLQKVNRDIVRDHCIVYNLLQSYLNIRKQHIKLLNCKSNTTAISTMTVLIYICNSDHLKYALCADVTNHVLKLKKCWQLLVLPSQPTSICTHCINVKVSDYFLSFHINKIF